MFKPGGETGVPVVKMGVIFSLLLEHKSVALTIIIKACFKACYLFGSNKNVVAMISWSETATLLIAQRTDSVKCMSERQHDDITLIACVFSTCLQNVQTNLHKENIACD